MLHDWFEEKFLITCGFQNLIRASLYIALCYVFHGDDTSGDNFTVKYLFSYLKTSYRTLSTGEGC